jgi:small subunit ribosomal protein S20
VALQLTEIYKQTNLLINKMANHKSSLKRIRQTATRKAHNHYYAKTARNAVRALRATTDKAAAEQLLPKVSSMLDKLAKRNIIHRNKAANLKSGLALHTNAL